MTWYNSVNIIAFFVTSVVLALIAVYSWRKRNTAAEAGVYCWIALMVSLLALLQMMSMIGPSVDAAYFFFKLRFISLAFTPVLWLLFVQRYTGATRLLSRSVPALAVIPLVTQIMVWTNDLHGLWMVRDATFYRSGPFFFPEIATRVAGPWYTVHYLYCYGLILIGMVILAVAAIRMSHEHRKQCLTVTAGTLITVFGSLFPSFNLVPGMTINPMPLGMTVGALIILWAVYRYRFLSVSPVVDRSKPVPVALLSLFAALTFAIIATGFLYYRQYRDQYKVQVERQLLSIADLKVKEITRWRHERLADGSFLQGNAILNGMVLRYFSNAGDGAALWQINLWLGKIKTSYGYDSIYLLDGDGTRRLTVPGSSMVDWGHLAGFLDEARRSGNVILSDLHREAPDKPMRLYVIAPLVDGQAGGRPLGFVAMAINPADYLYPMIGSWPAPSESAETFLVRRDGDFVLYLNELRFRKNSALNFRTPLTETQVASVMAVLGKEGIVEAVDYRGLPAIAALRSVPDSPWFLVAHIAAGEVYEPVRVRFWTMVLVVAFIIVGIGAWAWVLWQRQNALHIREQLESANKLREREDQYRLLADNMTDSVVIMDMNLKATFISPSVVKRLGYGSGELAAMTLEDVLTPGSFASAMKMFNEEKIKMDADASYAPEFSLDLELRRKDGTSVWSEYTVSVVRDGEGGDVSILCVGRDITERRRAEAALKDSQERYRLITENMSDVIWLMDMNLKYFFSTPSLDQSVGWTMDELNELPMDRFFKPESLVLLQRTMAEELTPERLSSPDLDINRALELECVRKDGSSFWGEVRYHLIRDAEGRPRAIMGVARDISERKRAEDAQRASRADLAEAQRMAGMGNWKFEKAENRVTWSDELYRIFNVEKDAFGGIYESFIHNVHPDDRALVRDTNRKALETGQPFNIEYRIVMNDGSEKYIYETGHATKDADGAVTGLFGYAQDITERKQIEIQLAASLLEKEMLVREIHHRVKNNLQIVTSLLSLQNIYISRGADVRIGLQEMQSRIKTMAIVHEKLYQSEHLARIDFREYITSLSESVFQSLSADPDRVKLRIDMGPVALGIDTAVPCGLLVNEIITNAMKHGFAGGREGVITVSMKKTDGGSYRLSIRDDGVGLPGEFDAQSTGTMGVRLIGILTRQIGGTLEVKSEGGAEFIITFPVEKEV